MNSTRRRGIFSFRRLGIPGPRPFAILFAILFAVPIAAAQLSGCVGQNGGRKSSRPSFEDKQGSVTTNPSPAPLPNLVIVENQSTITNTADGKFEIKLLFSVESSPLLPSNTIGSLCPVSTSAVYCQCVFTWTERNTTTPQNPSVTRIPVAIEFQRMAIMPLKSSLESQAACDLPSAYANEIGEGESIHIRIQPVVSHRSPFTTNTITKQKQRQTYDGQSSNSPSFVDTDGNRLDDIWRYSCHEKIRRGVKLESMVAETSAKPPNNMGTEYSETMNLAYASRFRFERLREQANAVLSAQLNYFNLYVAHNQVGLINGSNEAYSCPLVGGRGRIRAGASYQYFPLDSTFALAAQPSKTFSIPVEGRSRLSLSTKSDSNHHVPCRNTRSSGLDSEQLSSSGIVIACLGYAAAPLGNGSCPEITIRTGTSATETRPMYRLRRFNALYPPMYDTNGEWAQGYQAKIDQVYVLDRPAAFVKSDGQLVDGTMLGPKPCPFAWYDRAGVVTGVAGYRSTNDPGWKGKNPDGITLPTENDNGKSCPAVLPYNYGSVGESPRFRLKSLNAGSPEAQIRPIQAAWEPIYWEDTEFRACAPEDERTTRVRAPIHHVSKDGYASYCEEVYPTGHHEQRTSHRTDEGGSPTVSAIYVATDSSCGSSCDQYPLQATKSGIERALTRETYAQNHGCIATYAPGTTLAGVAYPRLSPTSDARCCKMALTAGGAEVSTHFENAGNSVCEPPR